MKMVIGLPDIQVRGVVVVTRRADIEKYGRAEARRRAFAAAGQPLPEDENELSRHSENER